MGIWKDSFSIVKEVYELSQKLPDDEKFGLKSQIQRCAVSIPSNIAEGSGRGNKEFIRFLGISLSSAYSLKHKLFFHST